MADDSGTARHRTSPRRLCHLSGIIALCQQHRTAYPGSEPHCQARLRTVEARVSQRSNLDPQLSTREESGAEGPTAERDALGDGCRRRAGAEAAAGGLLRCQHHRQSSCNGRQESHQAAEQRWIVELVARHERLCLHDHHCYRDADTTESDDGPAGRDAEDARPVIQVPRSGDSKAGRRNEERGTQGAQADLPQLPGTSVALHLRHRRPGTPQERQRGQQLPEESAEERGEEPDDVRESPLGHHPAQQDLHQQPEGIHCLPRGHGPLLRHTACHLLLARL